MIDLNNPDVIIGENYLSRWHVIPRNKFFNVYLHKFSGSDDDRAQHDHPWWSLSFLLKGEAKEHYLKKVRLVPRFFPIIRSAKFTHRLEVVQGPVWTLFITGPRIRQWGFHCPKGWVHWKEFTDTTGHKVGKGCNE